MCGIWISLNLSDDASRSALECVSKRGPDGEGFLTFETPSGRLHLGHKRLAIYDLSQAGHQPMTSVSGRFTIVYNGAVYNFQCLRHQLKDLGHRFNTQSDTEVILAGWEEWGAGLFEKIEGMFALAIYDSATQFLTLARDRFGEKPLLLATPDPHSPQVFCAGSDPLQILTARPNMPRAMNFERIANFLDSGQVESREGSFFHNINHFPAGHWMQLDLNSLEGPFIGEPHQWDTRSHGKKFVEKTHLSFDEASSVLCEKLYKSVKLRLLADAALGSCLSGGLDSTSLVRLAHKQAKSFKERMICICANFQIRMPDGLILSEKPYFDAAIEGLSVKPKIISPQVRDFDAHIDDVIFDQREPFPTTSIAAQWFVFREAKAMGLKVMLDGQGADELLAGYPDMLYPALSDQLLSGQWWSLYKSLRAFSTPETGITFNMAAKGLYNQALPRRFRLPVAKLRGRWPPASLVQKPYIYDPAPSSEKGLSKLDHCREQLVYAHSVPSLLRYEDRNAMAHSIESRLPFLDTEVSAFIQSLPSEYLIRDGRMKAILGAAMEGIVPGIILNRKRKMGFEAPHADWMTGETGQRVKESLKIAQSEWPGLFRQDAIEKLSSATSNDATLFRIFIFQQWAEKFKITDIYAPS